MTYASDFKELIPLLTRKEGGEAEDLDEAAPTSLEAQVEANALAQSLALGSDLGGDTRRSGEHYVGYNPLNPEEDWHVQRQKEKEDAIKAALDRMNWSNLVNLKAGGGAVADFKELIPLLTRNGGGGMSADAPGTSGEEDQSLDEAAATSLEAQKEQDRNEALAQSGAIGWHPGGPPDPDYDWFYNWQIKDPPIGEWRERDPILPRRSRKEGGGLSEIYRARGGSLPSNLCYNKQGKIVKCTSINRPNLEPDKPPTYDPLGIEGFLTSWDKDPMWNAASASIAGAIPGGALFMGLATQHMRQNYVNEIRAQYGLEPLEMYDIGETFEEQLLGKMTLEELALSGNLGDFVGTHGAVGRNPLTDPTVMHPYDYNPAKRALQESRDAHVQKARRDAREELGFHLAAQEAQDQADAITSASYDMGDISDTSDDDEGYPGDEYKKGGRIF